MDALDDDELMALSRHWESVAKGVARGSADHRHAAGMVSIAVEILEGRGVYRELQQQGDGLRARHRVPRARAR